MYMMKITAVVAINRVPVTKNSLAMRKIPVNIPVKKNNPIMRANKI